MTYTAITIGPIYDTISLTSSPAGLWAASYIFSHISRRLCELIVSEKLAVTEEDILSPYFSGENQTIDGIGRYPDRIVFKPADEQKVLERVQKLFDQIAGEIAGAVDEKSVDWFKQYLQMHAICFNSNETPILDCSQYLDAIEQEKTYPTGVKANPLNNMFESTDKNAQIRERIRDKFCDRKWPFKSGQYTDGNGNERMPDMDDITGRRTETARPRKKINSYYAIVQSDGDKFGAYIKGCKERCESERDFSKKCLNCCSTAANLVQEYGGVTIYAGGDDLLFLAPLTAKIMQKDGTIIDGDRNIFDLLVDLRSAFNKEFGKGNGAPTISFGVAIRYYKYPLYEAFDEAYKMLFDQAKCNRNAAAISMQKHSGKALEFVLEKFKNTSLTKHLQALIRQQTDGEVLSSIREKLWKFEPVFSQALSLGSAALENVFNNIFDSDLHKKYQADLDSVRELLIVLQDENKEDKNREKLQRLDSLLRFVKFWGEEGDEGDA